MTLKALYNMMVVEVKEATQAESGPLLTEMAYPRQLQSGVIVSIGPGGADSVTGTVLMGAEVLFPSHAGYEVKVDGKKFRVLENKDILVAVI